MTHGAKSVDARGEITLPESTGLPIRRRNGLPFVLLGALAICLFAIRLATPTDLLDHDQERPAAYVLDAVQNGHWICQRDLSGDISSKPPLWTWLCALATMARGRISMFTLYLPGAVAALASAWLMFAARRRQFGERAALFAAIALMLSPAGVKEFGLARTDGIFSLTVVACAFLAYRAWTTGRGWTWFWAAAAVSTLAKGPLGLVLGAGGLLAVIWERKNEPRLALRGSQLPGILLYGLIVGGWFALAYRQFGHDLVAKMLYKELAGHAMTDGNQTYPGMHFYQPPLYYLAQSAPWSLFGIAALWRLWKSPAANGDERRFERFLGCWFLLGMVIFSLSPNQRADHLWPILPAAALLAGRELSRLTAGLRAATVNAWAATLVAMGVCGFAVYYFDWYARRPVVRQSAALQKLAGEIEREGGRQFPLTHVDDGIALQVFLNTLRPCVSAERAAELLRGPEPAFVAVNNISTVEAARRKTDPPLFTPLPGIVGNRPRLEGSDSFAFCFGPVLVRAHHTKLLAAAENEFAFAPAGQGAAEIDVVNQGGQPRRLGIVFEGNGRHQSLQRLLAPGESWRPELMAR